MITRGVRTRYVIGSYMRSVAELMRLLASYSGTSWNNARSARTVHHGSPRPAPSWRPAWQKDEEAAATRYSLESALSGSFLPAGSKKLCRSVKIMYSSTRYVGMYRINEKMSCSESFRARQYLSVRTSQCPKFVHLPRFAKQES